MRINHSPTRQLPDQGNNKKQAYKKVVLPREEGVLFLKK